MLDGSSYPAVIGLFARATTLRAMFARSSITALVAALVVLTFASPRASGAPWLRPRPSDVPAAAALASIAPSDVQLYNDFATPERVFESRRVVVHYVGVGISAPPLNDDDTNAVPDYVERVARAADTAIDYFERRGFRAIRPDAGGPDARPDVYVSRFKPGVLGVALPATRAQGGAFAVVSNALDPSSQESFGSVYGTVAHELFHLTQFSYAAADEDAPFPSWVLEGTAAAMESRVHPGLDDLVSELQLRSWYAATNRSITTQTYGAQRLWHHLDRRYPRLLDAYLEHLGRSSTGEGLRELVETFRAVTGTRFGPAFHRFALDVAANDLARVGRDRWLEPHGRTRASVAPLAIHYVRLSVPKAGSYELRVRLATGGAGTDTHVSLVYQLESEIAGHPSRAGLIASRLSNGGRELTFRIPRALRQNPRFDSPVLVVSNGGIRLPSYVVSAR